LTIPRNRTREQTTTNIGAGPFGISVMAAVVKCPFDTSVVAVVVAAVIAAVTVVLASAVIGGSGDSR